MPDDPDAGAPQDAGAPAGAPQDGGAPQDAAAPQDGGAPQDAAAPQDVDAARGDDTNTTADPVNISLTVQCGHTTSGLRQVVGNPGADGRLQIVPSDGQNSNAVSLKIAALVQIQGQENTDGTDTIQASITDNSGNGVPNPQIAITQADAPSDGDWQSGMSATLPPVPSPGDNSTVWLADAQATVWNVFAAGNPDDTPVKVQLEAFPAYAVQGAVNLDFLGDVTKKINDACKNVINPLTGGTVTIEPQFQLPQGTLQVSCGWKENGDWQAYYGWSVAAGLNPFFGMGVKFGVDFVAIIGLCVDIPPMITKYAASLVLSVKVSGQVGISGTVSCNGPLSFTGTLNPNGQISVELALTAKVGNENVLSASISGGCTAGIKWAGQIPQPASPGGSVVLKHTLNFTGIVLTLTIVTTAFSCEMTNTQNSVTLMSAGDPVALDDITLIGADNS